MQKITTCLWFDYGKGEEAIEFYSSIFPDSKVLATSRNGDSGAGPKGGLLAATFRLAGQELMVLNGGPQFKFDEAISLVVHCESQEEIDRYWEKLLQGGGKESQCGWLKDRFGLSWQIVPARMFELIGDKDTTKADRVMKAVMKMGKLDLATMEQAYAGG